MERLPKTKSRDPRPLSPGKKSLERIGIVFEACSFRQNNPTSHQKDEHSARLPAQAVDIRHCAAEAFGQVLEEATTRRRHPKQTSRLCEKHLPIAKSDHGRRKEGQYLQGSCENNKKCTGNLVQFSWICGETPKNIKSNCLHLDVI